MSNNRLFIGNLSWDSDEDTLRDAFSQYGEVVDAKVITHRDTGKSRGFGFVTLATSQAAMSAIEALDGAKMDGRNIKVSIAEERRPRPGGGGGGGGGRDDRGGGRPRRDNW